MSELDLLADCVKDATKERDELADALEQSQTRNAKLQLVVDSLKAERSMLGHGEQNYLGYFEKTNMALDALDSDGQLLAGDTTPKDAIDRTCELCGIVKPTAGDIDFEFRCNRKDCPGWQRFLTVGESDPGVAVGPNATSAGALIVPDTKL